MFNTCAHHLLWRQTRRLSVQAIEMYVETVSAGQAMSLVGVYVARTGRGSGTHKATTLCLTVRAVTRSRRRCGAFMLHRYHQFAASGKLQWIRRVSTRGRHRRRGSGVTRTNSILAIPLAAHKLVTLAGKEYAKLIAKVVFEIDQTRVGINALGACSRWWLRGSGFKSFVVFVWKGLYKLRVNITYT